MFKIGDRVKYVDNIGDSTSKFSKTLTLGNIYTIVGINYDSFHLKEVNTGYGYSEKRFIFSPLPLHKNIRVL